MMRHVLLARVHDGIGVELRYIGTVPHDHLSTCASVALEQGFHLMYEMDREPDMAKAGTLARQNKLVTLEGVLQLWVLQREEGRAQA